jgi:DNA-binding Lrp family transcriptional regulator
MQPKIDEIDVKILKTLLKDSRTTFTEIAEDCGITVGAVRMRYKKLWRKGVINGEVTLVNPQSLGYEHVADLGIFTAVEHEKEVSEFLKNKQYKHITIVGPFGKYSIFAVAVFRNMQELNETIQELESHPHVKRVETIIWTEAAYVEHMDKLIFGPSIVEVETRDTNISEIPVLKKIKIDETDRRIAKILAQDARIAFKKIGEELGISTKNVIQRYNKLKGSVLTLSTITVDLTKLGYQAFAFFYTKVNKRNKIPEIYAQMLEIPNLIVIIKNVGPYDVHGTVFLHNFNDLFEATEQLRKIPGVDQTDIYVTPAWTKWPPALFTSLLQN